jgi:hypothetical protein
MGSSASSGNSAISSRSLVTSGTNRSDFVKEAVQNCGDWPTLGRAFRLRARNAHHFARAANLTTCRRTETCMKNATGVISNLLHDWCMRSRSSFMPGLAKDWQERA